VLSKIVKSLVGFAFVVVVLWMLSEESISQPSAKNDVIKLAVTTMFVSPEIDRVSIKTTGISQSRWPLEVRSSVIGKVVDSKVAIQPGTFVKKGELLAIVDDSEHMANLAQAESRISQAKLELARLRHEQTVLKQINQDQKQTPYGKLEPHVIAAKTELKAAQMAFDAAKVKSDETKILAPFDAVILDKQLAPGQWLNHGDLIYQLADRRYLDVRSELTQSQWQRLERGAGIDQINLVTNDTTAITASIRYIEPILDETTRQQGIVFEINSPFELTTAVMPGQQYEVRITGSEIKHVVKAPASVLTRDMTVWTVEEGVLKEEAVELLDEQPTRLKFRFISNPETKRNLVLFPLSTMLDGQAVVSEPIKSEPFKTDGLKSVVGA